jgi:virginiamycin B lyase
MKIGRCAALLVLSGIAVAKPPVRLQPIDELKAVATISLGATADWVAITDNSVWSGSTGPFAVHRIDPKTNQLVASVKLPGEPCAGLAAGFGAIWVPLCGKPAMLAKVDATRNEIAATFKMPYVAEEGGIAVSADSVWLVVDAKGVLARIDPATGAIKQRIKVPAGSYNPWLDGGHIWLSRADGAAVTSIDASTGTVTATIPSGQGPRFLTSGAHSVWTLNQRDGTLTRIDTESGQSRNLPIGMSGHGGDLTFADGMLWITLRRIPLAAVDAATNSLTCQWIGGGGDSMRIGFGSIWLTDYDGGTITRYDLGDATTRCRSQAHGLVGTWRLVRYEDRSPDGKAIYPFGEHPQGQLVYGADGRMSIQLMKVPHPKIASGDDEKVAPAEKQALYDAYVAYYGKYTVDETKHEILTEVEGDLADVFIGTTQSRPYMLDGDVLKLLPVWTSDGKEWSGLREFVRMN